MKNKKITYLLIVTAIALWGGILYKVMLHVEAMEGQEGNAFMPISNVQTSERAINMDFMKLSSSSRDPFLVGNAVDTVSVSKPIQTSRKQRESSQPVIKWSDISYFGFMSNVKRKYKLAILRISGTECTLGENQSYLGYKVLKILGDSLKIEYRGNRKIIKISQ